MITKGLTDIFGMTDMFQNRAVLTASQLSKLFPRAPGQPVRGTFLGRRADHRKTELALVPGFRHSAADSSVGKSLRLPETPLRLAAAPWPHRVRLSCPQVLASVSHHQLSPQSQATCLSFHLSFIQPSATQGIKP